MTELLRDILTEDEQARCHAELAAARDRGRRNFGLVDLAAVMEDIAEEPPYEPPAEPRWACSLCGCAWDHRPSLDEHPACAEGLAVRMEQEEHDGVAGGWLAPISEGGNA